MHYFSKTKKVFPTGIEGKSLYFLSNFLIVRLMSKNSLSERDTCAKFIMPAITWAGAGKTNSKVGEKEPSLNEFLSTEVVWEKYLTFKETASPQEREIIEQNYHAKKAFGGEKAEEEARRWQRSRRSNNRTIKDFEPKHKPIG